MNKNYYANNVFLIAIFLLLGCSVQQKNMFEISESMLDEVIASLDKTGSECQEDGYSTEDPAILSILKAHEFSIVNHSVEEEEDIVIHELILSNAKHNTLISAEISIREEKCLFYSFSRIAQGE